MKTNKKETNLIICNSYPTVKNPTAQIFIKNIKEQLESHGIKSYVYYNKIIDIWPKATDNKSVPANIIKYSVFILGLIPLCLRIHQFKTINPHGIIISGFIATLAESYFGAFFQHKIGWMSNELVNFIQTTFASVISISFALLIL